MSALEPGTHPSFLKLDRMALGAVMPEVAAHVKSCVVCSKHIARVSMTSVAPVAATQGDVGPLQAAPAWVGLLGQRPRPALLAIASFPLRIFRSRQLWPGWGVGVAAFACIALVWATARGPGRDIGIGQAESSYVGAKGSGGPVLWLHVKSGQNVSVWDEKHPLEVGDAIRLQVQPNGYRHISVFAPRLAPSGYDRLYEGPLVGPLVALPVSWTLDDRPGDEALVVVLGPAAVPPEEVAALLSRPPSASVWVRQLVLPKRLPRRVP